jgi:hypothetical protein
MLDTFFLMQHQTKLRYNQMKKEEKKEKEGGI